MTEYQKNQFYLYQLSLKKEQDRLQQHIFMTLDNSACIFDSPAALGVTDMEIKNMAQLMTFDSMSKDWKNNNGNTTNNGWPTFWSAGILNNNLPEILSPCVLCA